ncbi:hypothetical protein GCM10029964_071660 [Kibdelosporangium lantanae]
MDFPAPLGPTTASTDRFGNAKLTPSSNRLPDRVTTRSLAAKLMSPVSVYSTSVPLRSCNSAWPMPITSSPVTGSSVIRRPLTWVPFQLLRSTIRHWPAYWRSSACLGETSSSVRTTSQSLARPMVIFGAAATWW